MIRFFAIFFFAALSLANAQDPLTARSSSNLLSIPTFIDEQSVMQREWVLQNPISLEGPIDSGYIIGPGDFFEILLPNGSEFLQVSPEGTLAIQGCGMVNVSGLKLNEAKQKILEKLKIRYDQRFTGVHLVQLRRFPVSVQGAVFSPGQIIVSGQARAKEAVYLAGNYKHTANKDSVYIYRKGDTIATAENIILQAGDIIEVPHKDLQKTVHFHYAGKTSTLHYSPKRTIKEYLKEAGINIDQSFTEVSIKYQEENFTRWISTDQINNFVLDPMCEVEFHIQAPFVYVGGAVAAVGRVPYTASMGPADYVAASGVTLITGDMHRITVVRNGKRISIDWATGEILPGDFIEIPRTVYEQAKDITYFIASLVGIVATTLTIYLATR
ncbi:MAG: polysaccharide biosynthesis/export family protein [Fibromonadales bacterium]|nr:polysaccharide biosynthesis/export family protein [Fibromonadales bacterium]